MVRKKLVPQPGEIRNLEVCFQLSRKTETFREGVAEEHIEMLPKLGELQFRGIHPILGPHMLDPKPDGLEFPDLTHPGPGLNEPGDLFQGFLV